MTKMTRRTFKGRLAAMAALIAITLASAPLRAEEGKAKHHHDLRGVISKVEPEKNEFEIKTDAGRTVMCVIDKETTLRRGNEKITLKDVVPGDRARCHCASLRNGRHYSQSLQVEEKKDD